MTIEELILKEKLVHIRRREPWKRKKVEKLVKGKGSENKISQIMMQRETVREAFDLDICDERERE